MPVDVKDRLKNEHEGHRERMFDKLRKNGVDAFDDLQMLEMLLYLTIPRADTKELAKELMNSFGSFSRVLDAPVQDIMRVEGAGERTATGIRLIHEAFRAYFRDKCDVGVVMDTVDKYSAYLVCRMFGIPEEITGIVCLDGRFKFLSYTQLGVGTPFGTDVSNRRIVEAAVRCGAANVVIAHNHPSALIFPSKEDIESTMLIRALLESIEVRLLDHVITAENEYMSMFQWGYLNTGAEQFDDN